MGFVIRARLRAGTGQPLGLKPEAGFRMWNFTFGGAKSKTKANNMEMISNKYEHGVILHFHFIFIFRSYWFSIFNTF